MSEENRFGSDGKVHDKERLKELQALPLERKIQITQTRLIEWYTAWEGKCYVSFSGGKDSTALADLAAKVCKTLGYKLILWFSDTGLEYPEIKKNIDNIGKYLKNKYEIEVEIIKDCPKDKNGKRITFRKVLEQYGYPLISKRIARQIHDVKKLGESCWAYKCFNGEKLGYYDCRKYAYLINAPFNISNKCCDVMKKKPAHRFNKETGLKPIVGTMATESQQRTADWYQFGCNSFDAKKSCKQTYVILDKSRCFTVHI